MAQGKLKFGVALYSFADSYSDYRLDMEGMLRTAKNIGASGVSIVAAQHAPEYPYISDNWLYNLRNLLKKYQLEPVCWEGYLDEGVRADRGYTDEEKVEFTKNDIVYAKKAGFKMMKTQHTISPEVFRSMLPFCKRMDVKLTIEMHRPHNMHLPVWQEYLKIFADSDGYLGCLPDFSVWQHFPHKLCIDEALAAGCRKSKINAVLAMWKGGKKMEDALQLDLTPIEKQTVEALYQEFGHPASLDDLTVLLKYATMIHGKFYYIAPGAKTDPCIPFEKLIPIIKNSGFNGYILAEYEGHHHSIHEDDVEHVRRGIALMKSFYR